jgi:IS1 family transposase
VVEVWAFIHCKARNVATAKAAPKDAGDCWTWLAIDADTKLIPSFHVGTRDGEAAQHFIGDLANVRTALTASGPSSGSG